MPNIVGALAVLAVVFGTAWALGAGEVAYFGSCFVAVALVLSGLHLWANPKAPKTPREWAALVALAVVAGSIVFSIEMGVGKLIYPQLDFFQAGLHTGPFGGIATVVVTAGLAVVGVGGFFRSLATRFRDGA